MSEAAPGSGGAGWPPNRPGEAEGDAAGARGAADPAPPGQEQVFTADFLRGLFRRNENPHERDHFTLLGPSQGLSSGTRYIVAVSHL